MIAFLIGAAAAGGAYLYSKKKKASTGSSVAASAAAGAAGYGVAWGVGIVLAATWPLLLLGGAVAGGYMLGKKKTQKALPPASE